MTGSVVFMTAILTLNHPLDAARLKVARAEEHIRELQREIRSYLDSQPYDVIPSRRAGQGGPAVHLRVPPPHRLSAIVGDCLSNLRAAVDLTFWALALQTGPKDPDRDRIFFPIFSNEVKFQAAQVGFARYVQPEAVAVIEQVQPFRTRNAALAVLRTLSNQDKHGFLALTVREKENAEDGQRRFVVFDDTNLPAISVDVLLNQIARHITADVLPKFERLFA